MDRKYLITIGRQIGSGGLETAHKLSEQLGIKMYDKELLYEVSKQSGICPELFVKNDEKSAKQRIFTFFGIGTSAQENDLLSADSSLNGATLFKMQSEVMRDIASKESCIFVGRCADYVLRDMPDCHHFYITADLEFRAKRIAASNGLSLAEAKRFIEQGDRKRADYYNYYTFKKWGDASSYDLCIDSSKIGVDNVVEIIKYYINTITK
ncbi:MAG: cytidylate kinase-like family protein [Bacteroidales bacterium]|nr:cytidylate kinase-like family protein [Bacteroidales bacterium]